MPSSSKSQGLEAALWGMLMGGHRKANPPTPEAPSLCSSLPMTPDKRAIPKWEPFKTRSAMGKHHGQASLCGYGGGGACQQPALASPALETRPIQSGVDLKNQATQQPDPGLAREEDPTMLLAELTYLFSTHPHPFLWTMCSWVHVHTHRHPLWALGSPFSQTIREITS